MVRWRFAAGDVYNHHDDDDDDDEAENLKERYVGLIGIM